MKDFVNSGIYSFVIATILTALISSCAGSKKLAREQKVDTVISRARSFIGTPYRYGGTTTLGMDCSGLLMRSFESIDIYRVKE